MNIFKQAFKFIFLGTLILTYLVHTYFYSLFYRDIWKFREKGTKLLHSYSRWALKTLGVHVVKEGFFEIQNFKFLVCNHMSYLDVLVIASQVPTCFVTSVEIRETPFLGLLTKLGGCLYVERRNKQNLSQEIIELTEALQKNLAVTIFPEATSTNGEGVLRFRKPLFQSSIDAHVEVSPICINYCKINGETFSVKNRDLVCWYGDMTFLPHLWKLAGCTEIVAELKLLPKIPTQETREPIILAEASHHLVSNHFLPAQSEIT